MRMGYVLVIGIRRVLVIIFQIIRGAKVVQVSTFLSLVSFSEPRKIWVYSVIIFFHPASGH